MREWLLRLRAGLVARIKPLLDAGSLICLAAGHNDRVLHELEGYGAPKLVWDDRRPMLNGGRPSGEGIVGMIFSDDAVFELLEQGRHLVDTAIRFSGSGNDHVMKGDGLVLHVSHGVQLQLVRDPGEKGGVGRVVGKSPSKIHGKLCIRGIRPCGGSLELGVDERDLLLDLLGHVEGVVGQGIQGEVNLPVDACKFEEQEEN
ncbi:Os06g0102725 [Oryza sativa Japonica Group]|uniref:Os06g0102725 protein n=1 Tax=Oryza sativa subsp. japonica TaxID=39947 RepID=A0A0P0WRD0_ORYSJ|nr:hypothetical protein EE612_031570 [Oryza sativa]BAS95708.1 Os06g0102725 [Oryza sativa Japonica Group]